MSAVIDPGTSDPALSAYLQAASEEAATRALDGLLTGHLIQVVRDAVRRALHRAPWAIDHLDDVASGVQVTLIRRLQLLRSGMGEPVENVAAYAARSADHACSAFLRQQFPQRSRLRNRLRYALTHHPATTLEADGQGVWRCHVKGLRRLPPGGNSRLLVDAPLQFIADKNIDATTPLPVLAHALLGACEVPVEFDRFVDAVAAITGVSDAPVRAGGQSSGDEGALEAGDALARVADESPGVDVVLEHRASLRAVWEELVALPVRQRAALLLNLRDPEGGSMLQMLPATGVVTTVDIARALEITEAQLSALWNELPLDDLSIAGRLGLTRQQVINLEIGPSEAHPALVGNIGAGRASIRREGLLVSELRILPPRDPDMAAVALLRRLASTPDDFEHPEHELLAALVDGTLADADREWVEGHLEFCPLCKEDVADLAGVRAQLADVHAHATAPRMGWLKPAIAIGTVAAGLALVVWWGGQTAPVTNTPVADVPAAVAENQPDVPTQVEQVLTEDERAAVARALESGRVVFPPNVRLLRGQSGTLLGPGEPVRSAPVPQSPVGMATSSPRPTFVWRASEGATGYTVAVFDERFRKVAESVRLTETTWTPPTNLPRGRMLAWQVTAHLPDGDVVSPAPPQPEARFVVLTRAETAEVTEQRERLANEPIALGLVLARLGLFDDAEAVLRQALDDSRFNRTDVQSLIDSLDRRGR